MTDLKEATLGPAEPNIATTDENLSVDQMYQQRALPSLGRQIFSVVPMHGPTAAVFNVRRKAGTNNFELVRNEVAVYPSDPIKTDLTQEVVQDIKAQYGKEADEIIGTLLRGLSNDDENTKTLAFLDANSLATTGLTLSNSLNAETNLFEIIQRVNELVLTANSKNMRTYEAYAVLPYAPLASIMSLHNYAGGEHIDERGLFVAHIGQTKFYMNPDPNSLTAYVGLKDSNNPSKSSAIFSPYTDSVISAIDPDSGELFYHIFNRYAITQSPLHEAGNELMFKFDITL